MKSGPHIDIEGMKSKPYRRSDNLESESDLNRGANVRSSNMESSSYNTLPKDPCGEAKLVNVARGIENFRNWRGGGGGWLKATVCGWGVECRYFNQEKLSRGYAFCLSSQAFASPYLARLERKTYIQLVQYTYS